MRAGIKRFLSWLSTGAFLGFLVWSLLGRSMTSLFFGSLGGSFTCRADVQTALDDFVSMQLYSALGGGLVAMVVMLLLMRRRARRAAAVAAPEPVPGS
jgi:hypothetical protein